MVFVKLCKIHNLPQIAPSTFLKHIKTAKKLWGFQNTRWSNNCPYSNPTKVSQLLILRSQSLKNYHYLFSVLWATVNVNVLKHTIFVRCSVIFPPRYLKQELLDDSANPPVTK